MHLVPDLPEGWMPTRSALQLYANAITAFPRAGAPADPSWSHVAMVPTLTGFAAAPTPLGDGSTLTSAIDLSGHRLEVCAGDDRLVVDLREGTPPSAVGADIERLAASHGATFSVDRARFAAAERQHYDPGHAALFRDAARAATEALDVLNAGLVGHTAGPHLWPHGFDIATEWFSDRIVAADGHEGRAQIAVGWYPGVHSYVYVNPWPFADSFASIDLPGSATWHIEGWQGAKLDVPEGGALPIEEIVALARRVHEATAPVLGA
jgi:hypothetical protein